MLGRELLLWQLCFAPYPPSLLGKYEVSIRVPLFSVWQCLVVAAHRVVTVTLHALLLCLRLHPPLSFQAPSPSSCIMKCFSTASIRGWLSHQNRKFPCKHLSLSYLREHWIIAWIWIVSEHFCSSHVGFNAFNILLWATWCKNRTDLDTAYNSMISSTIHMNNSVTYKKNTKYF